MNNHEIKIKNISFRSLKQDLLEVKNDILSLRQAVCVFTCDRYDRFTILNVEKIAKDLKMDTVFIFGENSTECFFYW